MPDLAPLFRDRTHAGSLLAQRLLNSEHPTDSVVLALPRGGVPVAYEVAQTLHADFDIFLVRKLGLPGDPELAVGAIASGGIRVLNDSLVRRLRLSSATIDRLARTEEIEIARQEHLYRKGRPPVPLANRDLIVVDDGLATGATMRAALKALRLKTPGRIVVAVPVAPPDICRDLQSEADRVLCLATPAPFDAVGNWYENFAQTTDDEVRSLLQQPTAQVHS